MERKFLMRVISTVILGAIILMSGCEFDEPMSSGNSTSAERNLSTPLFKVNYDEKTTTYAYHWPGNVLHENTLDKPAGDEDVLYMIDYQFTNKTIAFDDQGYFHYSTTNVEGDQSIRLPQSIWAEVKNDAPARAPNHRAINEVTFSNGMFQSIYTNGEIAHTGAFDPEEYKVDPETLEAYRELMNCDTCVAGNREEILASLEESASDFAVSGNVLLLENLLDIEGYSRTKKVIDLTTGLTMQTAIYKDNGQFHSVSLNEYRRVNGYPVRHHQTSYNFGDVNGNWQAKTVTHVDRSNINVDWSL